MWCAIENSSCFKLLIFFCVLWIFYHIQYQESSLDIIRASVKKPKLPEFKDFESANTKTYHMVCMTNIRGIGKITSRKIDQFWHAKNRSFKLLSDRECRYKQKLITVYDNITKWDAKKLTIKSKSVGYNIEFKHISDLPSDYVIIDRQTAYFLGKNKDPFEPQNFFHFTKQVYFPLYWLIKSTNQLHNGASNLVFYPDLYGICDEDIVYHDINSFKYFRDILHIENKLELSAFIDKPEPHKICYKNAVFSNNYFLEKATEAIDYFKNSLNVVDNVCKNKRIIILNRSNYRRILNTEELKKVGEEMGYDTQVVAMEKLTWKEQAQLVHCTNILVGVAGAGLQWAFFMKDHSGVIEIAWPDKEWPYFFAGTGSYRSGERDIIRPLKFVRLKGTCRLNPAALSIYAKDTFYKNISIPYNESLEILQNEENYNFKERAVTSVGKLCDVTVEKEAFRNAVQAAS